MPSVWTRKHLPVFTNGPDTHILFTEFNRVEPYGQIVRCPIDCGRGMYWKDKNSMIKVLCLGCGAVCYIPKLSLDTSSNLGRVRLIRTTYPQVLHQVSWKAGKGQAQGTIEPLLDAAPIPSSSKGSVSSTPVSEIEQSVPAIVELPPDSPPHHSPSTVPPSHPPTPSSIHLPLPPAMEGRSRSLPTEVGAQPTIQQATSGFKIRVPGGNSSVYRSRSAPALNVSEEPEEMGQKRQSTSTGTRAPLKKKKRF
jgi:hypothetical protein